MRLLVLCLVHQQDTASALAPQLVCFVSVWLARPLFQGAAALPLSRVMVPGPPAEARPLALPDRTPYQVRCDALRSARNAGMWMRSCPSHPWWLVEPSNVCCQHRSFHPVSRAACKLLRCSCAWLMRIASMMRRRLTGPLPDEVGAVLSRSSSCRPSISPKTAASLCRSNASVSSWV